MEYLEKYQNIVEKAIEDNAFTGYPQDLYDPINYIMQIGGKRFRPIIGLMGCDLFDGDLEKTLKPTLAIEYFHNFSLMHDDIMDEAEVRRGKKSVHYKYGLSGAILSGDALLVKSYQFFEDLEPILFKAAIRLFSKTAIQICEGQQLDINFSEKKDVSIDDYFEMITLKTGVLPAAALQIGAMIAGASQEDAQNLYDFGKHIGIAFQLMDDYLDVFGDTQLTGKKHGGDIFENKKTILYLKALEKALDEDRDELLFWYNMKTDNIDKVYAVEKLFHRLDVKDDTAELIEFHTQRGLSYLEMIDFSNEKKKPLISLADYLIERTQ